MKESRSEKLFNVVVVALISLLCLVIIIPVIHVVNLSFVTEEQIVSTRGFVIFPRSINLQAYAFILRNSVISLPRAYMVTIFRCVANVIMNIIGMYLLGYGLARRDLPGRNTISMYLFITMIFSGGLVPSFLLIRSLGLTNSIWVYVIPSMISPWFTFLIRNFIMQIPESIHESAEIEGASQLCTVFRIVMPITVPALATFSLFILVGQYNAWFDAFLYVRDIRKHPVASILREVIVRAQIAADPEWLATADPEEIARMAPTRSVQNATIVLTTLPVVFVYPWVQRYFVKGIVVGSVKG